MSYFVVLVAEKDICESIPQSNTVRGESAKYEVL